MSEAFKQLLKSVEGGESNPLTEQIRLATEERAALKKIEFEVHKANILAKHSDLVKRQEDKLASEKFNLNGLADEYYSELAISNSKYFEDIKDSAVFLDNAFQQYIPYFTNNLILIGARSGNGKSTITANLALNGLKQDKNVLIITNEEIVSDVYNRITCLANGWFYVDHKSFSPEQIEFFNKQYPALGKKVRVVADHHNGRSGLTTTYEGVKSILESLHKTTNKYDIIIIDYFQNVSSSLEFPNLEEWKVLDKLSHFLDGFRKVYNAPIVLLAQLKSTKEDSDTPYKERIERCKSIYNMSTCAIEVEAIPDQLSTKFTIHKSRFSQGIGKSIIMGFYRGMYIPLIEHIKRRELEDIKKLKG